MWQEMSRKAMSEMRDGVETAWDRMGRVQWTRPWSYVRSRKPALSANPWVLVAAGAAVVIGIAAYFWLRKRRQVADHYTMGETGSAAGHEMNGRGVAGVDGAGRRVQPA